MASLSPIIFHWKIKHSASHFLCHINMTTPFDIGIQGMLEPQEHTWNGFFLSPWGFPGGSSNKKSTCSAGDTFSPWVMKIPWRRKWQPTPVFLPRKFHGQRSLEGYSPWGSQRVGHGWTHTYTFAFRENASHNLNLPLLWNRVLVDGFQKWASPSENSPCSF